MTLLILGGSGRLGRDFRAGYPHWLAPSRQELDITDAASVGRYFENHKPTIVIHAAAVVGRNEAEADRIQAIRVNVEGTANIAHQCSLYKTRLVYISSAAVFDGQKGNYSETDTPNPSYFYGWTKYAGEQSTKMVDNSVIVRTDFFVPEAIKYSRAFTDHFCSKIIVSELSKALNFLAMSSFTGVLHVGTQRDTLYNKLLPYAPHIAGVRIRDSTMPDFPLDFSLNISRFTALSLK